MYVYSNLDNNKQTNEKAITKYKKFGRYKIVILGQKASFCVNAFVRAKLLF